MSVGVDPRAEELAAIIREIRDRVRTGTPSGKAGSLGVPLPDLLPILHARDIAEGKAAAIGTVNPRPPGLVNNALQAIKRSLARSLNWLVREQVEFNHATIECVQATLNALNENNRVLTALAAEVQRSRDEAGGLRDAHSEWLEWRRDWELRLSHAEVRLLRSVGDLSTAYEHHARELARDLARNLDRQLDASSAAAQTQLAGVESSLKRSLAEMDAGYRQSGAEQHAAFTAEAARSAAELQKSLRSDFETVRREYETIIHHELRLLRQRAASAIAPGGTPGAVLAPAASHGPAFDYTHFADRFRGSEEYVRGKQEMYASYFSGRRRVLDIGCGRGEFLDVALQAPAQAKGIDLDSESIAYCRAKGHDAEQADLFEYLAALPDGSLDGIFSSQVIEHLPPERLPDMVRLCAAKLERGGVIALETPNPECLAIFATHFYIDPTHTRPVPPSLLSFYLEESGFGGLEIRRLSPAIETMPSIASLPEDFRQAFFGALDYAAIARKL